MAPRRVRVGRPSPRNKKHFLYIPVFPKGWLQPLTTEIPWEETCGTGTTCTAGCAADLAAPHDLSYMKAAVGEAKQAIPSRSTFREAADDFLTFQAKRVDANTLHVMRSHLRSAAERFGSRKVSAITKTMLEDYQTELWNDGDGLAPATVNARIRTIIDVIKRAAPGMRPTIAKFTPTEDEPETREEVIEEAESTDTGRYVTAPELDRLFAEIKRDLPGLALLAELRSVCGVRTHALGATRQAHRREDRIVIPKRLMKNRRANDARDYVLPIVGDVKRILSKITVGNPESFLFVDEASKPLLGSKTKGGLSSVAQRVWNAAVEKVGLHGMEFADLRHVAASRIQKTGRNDLSRKIVMGWATGIDGRYVDHYADATDTILAVSALLAQERKSEQAANVLPYRQKVVNS